MHTIRPTIRMGLVIVLITGVSLLTVGCSDDSPNGPGAAPMDEITVSLTSISVKYDCDNNVSFVDDAVGDFYYAFIVAIGEDEDFEVVHRIPEREVKLNNGESVDFNDQSVTFTLPRETGRRFRVLLTLREEDPGRVDDFLRKILTIHQYEEGQREAWEPVGRRYSFFSSSVNRGFVQEEFRIRDQTKFLGIVSTEGCRATARYDVSIKPLN